MKDVSCRVESGEFVAVLGQNGAGKSSLLKCVTGLYSFYKGDIELNGHVMRRLSRRESARRASYVPQLPGALGAFTARRFVAMSRYPWKKPFEGTRDDDWRIVDKALDMTGGSRFAERFVDSLSGGERQKVLIAGAIAQSVNKKADGESALFLLDEPTASLDYRHQAETMRLISELHASGASILMVTHDIDSALNYAGRIIILDDGQIVWDGKPENATKDDLLERFFGVSDENHAQRKREQTKTPASSPKRNNHNMFWIILAASLLVLCATPFIGAKTIAFSGVLDGGTDARIFWELRVPRVVLAWLCGSTLGLCGMIFQALFRNPLAEPTMLGVASGASFGAALCIYMGFGFSILGLPAMAVCAFLAALLCVAALQGAASLRPDGDGATLLLVGVAMNFFFSSLVMILQYIGAYQDSYRLLRWTLGGVQAIGFTEALRLLPAFIPAIAVSLFFAPELDLMLSGSEIAASRGVDLERVRKVLFLTVSFCVALCVAFCGPVAFVGLIVPHITRLLVGAAHRRLAAASAVFGGSFLVLCDAASRVIFAPIEVPVGIITSFLGAPFFLWLLMRGKDR